MRNVSTGTGLLALGLGIAVFPLVSRLSAPAEAAVSTSAAMAISAAATSQAGPTVVWRGVTQQNQHTFYHRLWSDGKLEVKAVARPFPPGANSCNFGQFSCASVWITVPGTNNFDGDSGFAACTGDVNGDAAIDGTDLALVLSNWGGATGCTQD